MKAKTHRLIAKLRRQLSEVELTAQEIGASMGCRVSFFSEDGSVRLVDSDRDDTEDASIRIAQWPDGGAVIMIQKYGKVAWGGGGV